MMRHERPQRLPFDLPVTPPVADLIERKTGTRDIVQAFDTDFRGCGARFPGDPAKWRAAYEALGLQIPQNAEIDGAGCTHVPPPPGSTGKAYHFREMLHPLSIIEDVKQLEQLPWPDLDNPHAGDGLPARIAEIRRAGKVSTASIECTLFEAAWYVRGMDNLFGDLLEGNGIADWLLDWFTERSMRCARISAAAGVDVIGLGDDVGTQRGMMMSVDFWREHFKPRLKKVIDAIREVQKQHVYVRYHSDGDIRLIIDDLIDIGVDILNPIQPECMPVDEVVSNYKNKIAFWGIVGTQTTMPFGTAGDVRSVVAHCARLAREGAAVVIAPTHVLEPDVPWENIAALADAAHETRLF